LGRGDSALNGSASDSDHPATKLIIMPEIVLFGFAFDHLAEKLAQLLVACPFSHRRFDIEFDLLNDNFYAAPESASPEVLRTGYRGYQDRVVL
jgi:hypothetical protein